MSELETSENKPKRDENGRLLPGGTANPNGRPKGAVSVTEAIKRILQKELPEATNEEKRTYLDQIVQKIMDKALSGDEKMLKNIWNYIDGMPQQSTDITSGGKPIPILGNVPINTSNEEDSQTEEAH